MRSKKINGIQEILDAASRRQFIKAAGSLLLLPLYDIIIPDAEATNFLARPAAGGGSCPADGSPSFEEGSAVNANQHIGANTDHYYGGQIAWNNGTQREICKMAFNMSLGVGTIVGLNYRAEVWTQSGNNLNTRLGFSADVAGSDAWSSTLVYFDLSANKATVPASTNVALVCRRTDGSADASNYVRLNTRETTGTLTGNFATWNTSGVLESNQTTFDQIMRGYWTT